MSSMNGEMASGEPVGWSLETTVKAWQYTLSELAVSQYVGSPGCKSRYRDHASYHVPSLSKRNGRSKTSLLRLVRDDENY